MIDRPGDPFGLCVPGASAGDGLLEFAPFTSKYLEYHHIQDTVQF